MNSIREMLVYIEEEYSNRVAFEYVNGNELIKVTFKDYCQYIWQTESYIRSNYNLYDKKIGILSHNNFHSIVLMMAIMLSGAIVVPLNTEESIENIRKCVKKTEMEMLFSDGLYDNFEKNNVLSVKDFVISANNSGTNPIKQGYYDDIEKTSMILFTSGTTGNSKGVMISQKNMFSPLKMFIPSDFNDKNSKAFLVAPIYHVAGIVMLLSWNSIGAQINLCESPMYLLRDIGLMNSDFTFFVPIMLKSFCKDMKKGKTDRLGGIKTIFCGGATVDPEYFGLFEKNGIKIIQVYSMTELCGKGTTNLLEDSNKVGSIGKIDAECELRIIEGEICIKGDCVTSGYYNDYDETINVIEDGFFHTGDLGYIDEDGYVFLSGRKKNLIILESGENVSPEELENLIMKCNIIKQVMVFESKGKICAEIICAENMVDKANDYIKELNSILPGYKRINRIIFNHDELEQTSLGKIKRRNGL